MSESHTESPVIGRLAPTPSGLLHTGNMRTFMVAWLLARQAGGRVILRVEDIDRARCRPDLEIQQLEDLRWLGFDWDEGPDVGGPHGPYRQSECLDRYRESFKALQAAGLVYPCTCSRKDILASASAPHAGEEIRYPSTCRARNHSEPDEACAWRLRVPEGKLHFADLIAGPIEADIQSECGDFVIWRKDDWPSYQLAVVVDDALMCVTQVVRGADLLSSTARQQLLMKELGLPEISDYVHIPLVVDEGGERLAKRRDSRSVKSLRESGISSEALVGRLAKSLGCWESGEPIRLKELVGVIRLDSLPRHSVNFDTLV